MSLDELLSVVRESKLVSSDNILDAIQLRNTLPSHKLKFRGQLSMFYFYKSIYFILVNNYKILLYTPLLNIHRVYNINTQLPRLSRYKNTNKQIHPTFQTYNS